jgi:hypothetical protein
LIRYHHSAGDRAAQNSNHIPDGTERPAVERLNRSNLYQSDAEGNQPYPNPDRELYVNRSCC